MKYFDGQKIDNSDIKDLNVSDIYINRQNGRYDINFVGVILKENGEIIYSFPKKYAEKIEEINQEDCDLLLTYMLMKGNKASFGDEDTTNFPLRSYINIVDYYRKYGLYKDNITIYKNRLNGNINWKKTIKKIDPVITNNNLIYPSFIVDYKYNIDIFLTECMKYTLSYTFNRFKRCNVNNYYILNFFDQDIINNPMFMDFEYIVDRLKFILNKTFNDNIKNLIKNMIDFFSWISKTGDKSNIGLVITDFNNDWEKLVDFYLNRKLHNKKVKFKKKTINKSQIDVSGRITEFELDHYLYDEDTKIIYILDSKYYNYNDINQGISFNFKQFVYHFNVLKYANKQKIAYDKIINCLIMPSYDEDHIALNYECDYSFFDNNSNLNEELYKVKIEEYYINLKRLMLEYTK